jgi:biotin carboxyl carrier protein
MNKYITFVNGVKKEISFINQNKVVSDDSIKDVFINKLEKNIYLVHLGKRKYICYLLNKNANKFEIFINNKIYNVECKTQVEIIADEIISHKRLSSSKTLNINSPMPGLVLKIFKKDGDTVKRGEPVLILEAMKMENEILAPADGIIEINQIKEGDSVEKNVTLFKINNLIF